MGVKENLKQLANRPTWRRKPWRPLQLEAAFLKR
jgi:hypothetical protein